MYSIQNLFEKSYQLLHLGEDGLPLYADDLSALNSEVDQLSTRIYEYTAKTLEEEAKLCCALLISFAATYTSNPKKHTRLSKVLKRAYQLLSGTTQRWPGIQLSDGLIRSYLALYAYTFTYDQDLLEETGRILKTWEGRDLNKKEIDLVNLYTISTM